MSAHTSRKGYRDLRESFDELDIQDKALFLVEASVSTLARGIETAGRTLADELGDVLDPDRPRGRRGRPGAARPASSERQAPHPPRRPDEDTADEPPEAP